MATAQSNISGVCIARIDWRGDEVKSQSRKIDAPMEIHTHGLEKNGMEKNGSVAERDWRRFAIWVSASVVYVAAVDFW